MIKQLKNYFYERFTDFTISPPNFLPMIVTTRDKATQLMEGKLEMPPMLSREQVEAWEAAIRRKYPVLPEKESITKGYLINTADLYTLGFSMIPLVFDQGHFVKPDRRLLKEGDTAVIFLQPQLFFQQLQVQVQQITLICAIWSWQRRNIPEMPVNRWKTGIYLRSRERITGSVNSLLWPV